MKNSIKSAEDFWVRGLFSISQADEREGRQGK
jgi:hypothetical protein